MTRRITVSLPDDVAQYLDKHPNSSQVVADAVRERMQRGEAVRKALEAVGFVFTEQSRAWARAALRPLNDDQRAEIARRRKEIHSGKFRQER
jgi:metal-responsive CopG/Arc/MetJ family transcriptional regulator